MGKAALRAFRPTPDREMDVVIGNPGGAQDILIQGHTYFDAHLAYLPLVLRSAG